MFGETESDPTRQFDSVGIEEQLDALGRAVDAARLVRFRHFLLQSVPFLQYCIPLYTMKLIFLVQVRWH